MSNIKYYVESTLISKTEVTPIFNGAFSFELEQDRLYYTHKCKGKLKFIDADYELIMQHKDDACEDISIIVETSCADNYELYWRGKFKIFDTTRDDPKWLTVTPVKDGVYECFETALKDKQNIYSDDSADYVTVSAGHGTRDIIECVSDTKAWSTIGSITGLTSDPFPLESAFTLPDYPTDCVNGEAGYYRRATELHITLDETRVHDILGTYRYMEYVLLSRYVRWSVRLPCVGGVPTPPTYPSGLIINGVQDVFPLLEDDCAGTGMATFGTAGSSSVGDYTRGRLFGDILTQVVTDLNCGLTLVSDFFNINADNTAPNNKAYIFAEEYLHNLTLHQKSDIKRKDSTSPSKVLAWDVEVSKLFGDLRKLFNVFPVISDGTLRLENYSYFDNMIGWDISDKNISTEIDSSGNGLIKTENFYYADEACSALFKAQEIKYNCGNDNKDTRCEIISVDVAFIENTNNEAEINDTGFVLISNKIRAVNNGSQYVMVSNNIPLRWSELLENLHVYGRLYKSGELNGVQQDFESWKPYEKAKAFTVDFCCDDVWSPENLMRTKIGLGKVQEAEHNIYKNTLKPKLLY